MSKMLYTRCLQDLHRVNINYVHRLVQSNSKTSSSKHENGFKLYISSYIHDYEVSDKNEAGEVSVRASCFRSMRKKERPHNLSLFSTRPHITASKEQRLSPLLTAAQGLSSSGSNLEPRALSLVQQMRWWCCQLGPRREDWLKVSGNGPIVHLCTAEWMRLCPSCAYGLTKRLK
ncbi:uncharacterized protein LOC127629976 isoform X4 [Xyrauchen texanus]|uniref:uncharacterized protein LOC127629976 isoform X4 n=1 Tax=Xyrauchen texanus TaxID=154827 RepID=UPI00224291FE|nr:uncharacterized protein LOC127629976 isoform X4 [Xyrauchen texanus]